MAKPNWKNQTIWTGDNLEIMRGMNGESVDLIYLDPPFNSKANYAAPAIAAKVPDPKRNYSSGSRTKDG